MGEVKKKTPKKVFQEGPITAEKIGKSIKDAFIKEDKRLGMAFNLLKGLNLNRVLNPGLDPLMVLQMRRALDMQILKIFNVRIGS